MTTTPNAKKIFVLEDKPEQLNTYIRLLERRRFHVRGAKNREELENVLKSDESFDLLLLDMYLKDEPGLLELNLYGSDVGKQLVNRQAAWPPEVIIMTAHSGKIDFWRRAFAIGAAAFLEKGKMSLDAITNHVYVMLLRRAVSLHNPRCKEVINEVLGRGGREPQLLEEFFRRLVLPEFEACLGSPFIMVLEHVDASPEIALPGATGAEASLSEHIVELVAKASYYTQVKDLNEPFRLDEEVLNLAALPARGFPSQIFLSTQLAERLEAGKESASGVRLSELLEEAAFIPLQITIGVRLSLLLIKEKTHSKGSEDLLPLSLAKLLAKYSLDPLRMTLTNLIERWKNEQKIKQVQLQELARFCQYVGAETKRITFGAESEGFVPAKNTSFNKLALLADELSGAGDFLRNLGEEKLSPSQRLVLREIILEAWDSLWRGGGGNRSIGMSFRGDNQATVVASKEELLFIFSRLLHWLASFYEDGEDAPQGISIECRLEGRNVKLSLESDSPRLNKILRDNIFVPMTQRIDYSQVLEGKGPKLFLAMYLAKTILEKRYKGSLTDHSDELPGQTGHRLILRMPVINR